MGGRERMFGVLMVLALTSGLVAQTRSARPAGSGIGASTDEIAAKVGDRTITLDQLDKRWGEMEAASRAQVRQQMYDARRRVLDEMIGEYLIEQEAKAKGLSTERFLEIELPKRMRPITDQEIAAVYNELESRAGGAKLEQLAPAIRQYLEQQRPVEARQALIKVLRKASTEVRVTLEPPRLQVTAASTDPVLGPASALVEVVEFSDFQCPFCGRAESTVAKLRAAFGDRVRWVYKDFPLPNHPDAFPAAEAAQCAREQGKFWEYHDILFANQQALGRDDLKRHAAALGLDTATFNPCFDESRFKYLVQADIDESQRYGVSSTPTFFINGRMVTGAQPFEVFEQVIREELALKR